MRRPGLPQVPYGAAYTGRALPGDLAEVGGVAAQAALGARPYVAADQRAWRA
jgi:hypothetical protein